MCIAGRGQVSEWGGVGRWQVQVGCYYLGTLSLQMDQVVFCLRLLSARGFQRLASLNDAQRQQPRASARPNPSMFPENTIGLVSTTCVLGADVIIRDMCLVTLRPPQSRDVVAVHPACMYRLRRLSVSWRCVSFFALV